MSQRQIPYVELKTVTVQVKANSMMVVILNTLNLKVNKVLAEEPGWVPMQNNPYPFGDVVCRDLMRERMRVVEVEEESEEELGW